MGFTHTSLAPEERAHAEADEVLVMSGGGQTSHGVTPARPSLTPFLIYYSRVES